MTSQGNSIAGAKAGAEDSIILTKERRRGREIIDSYRAIISLVYAIAPRPHVTLYNLSS
jgi:hypothetical protein